MINLKFNVDSLSVDIK